MRVWVGQGDEDSGDKMGRWGFRDELIIMCREKGKIKCTGCKKRGIKGLINSLSLRGSTKDRASEHVRGPGCALKGDFGLENYVVSGASETYISKLPVGGDARVWSKQPSWMEKCH